MKCGESKNFDVKERHRNDWNLNYVCECSGQLLNLLYAIGLGTYEHSLLPFLYHFHPLSL